MDAIAQGLTLSIIGVTITFAALGLLILAIVVLNRLFSPQSLVSDEDLVQPQKLNSSARDTEDEEIAAAIAVAWAVRSLDVSGSELGTALEAGRGPWWVMSQLRQHPTGTRTSQGRRHR